MRDVQLDGISGGVNVPVGKGRFDAGEFGKLAVSFYILQTKPPQGLSLGEQRNPRSQQHRSNLNGNTVHQVLVQQRRENGVSANHPDILIGPQFPYKLRRVSGDRREPRM